MKPLKKILLSALLAMTLLVCCLSATALADEVSGDSEITFPLTGTLGPEEAPDSITWTLTEDGVFTVSGKGATKTGELQTSQFSYLSDYIKEVVVEEGVTSLGQGLFMNCTSLEKITFPDSLESILGACCSGCTSLTEINFGKGLTFLGSAAFSDCTSLKRVELPDSLSEFGNNGALSGGFPGCTALEYVKLPASMTSIPSKMFYGCTELKHIVLPKNLKSVGDWAFKETALEELELPEGLTSIGEQAFCGIKIKSVTFPKSLTKLDSNAFLSCKELESVTFKGTSLKSFSGFAGCSALEELIVPEGVETIGGLNGCTLLSNLILPSTLKTISSKAFMGCPSLQTLVVPDGVTTIEYGIFYGEYNAPAGIKEIVLPATLEKLDSDWYLSAKSLIVQYKGSREQWEKLVTLSNGSIPSAYSNGKIIVYYDTDGIIGDRRNASYVPVGSFAMRVLDGETGLPVAGAVITAEWLQSDADAPVVTGDTTSKQGKGLVEIGSGDLSITISADGYLDWRSADNEFWRRTYTIETVLLYPEETGALKLSTARYGENRYFSRNIDILVCSHVLNLNTDELVNSTGFYLSCKAAKPDEAVKYELYQGSKKIAESESGLFSDVKVVNFVKGGYVFVRVTGKDGSHADTPIRLSFADNVVYRNEDSAPTFDLPDISLSVDADYPFLGGNAVTLSMPDIFPVRIVASKDKLQLVINVKDLAEGNSATDQAQEKYDDLKKQLSALETYMKWAKNDPATYDPKYEASFDQLWDLVIDPDDKVTGLSDGWEKKKVTLMGYLEGNWGDTTLSGKLVACVSFNIGAIRYNSVIGVTPVTASVGLGLSGSVIEGIQYDYESKMLHGNLDFNGKATLTAFAGVGYDKYIGAGAYGKGELEVLVRFMGDLPHGLRLAVMRGEMGLKAYIGGLEKERAWAEAEWPIVNNVPENAVNLAPVTEGDSAQALAAPLYEPEGYKKSDLSYTLDSTWNGGKTSDISSSIPSLSALETDVYRNAQPTLAGDGSALYMAFVDADAETGVRRLQAASYAAPTGTYGSSTWTDPVIVDESAVLDGSPVMLAADDGTLWLAYTRTESETDGTLLDFARKQAVVVGTLDKNDLSFTQAAIFTSVSKSGYVSQPQFSVLDGKPVVSWTDSPVSSDADVLQPSSVSIRYAVFDGESWSEPAEAVSVKGAVRCYTLGEQDGALAAAYSVDGALKLTSAGKTSTLAEDFTGKVTYAALPGSTEAAFLWNSRDSLESSDGSSVAIIGLTSEYCVGKNGIYFSIVSADGAHLASVRQENGTWFSPVELTGGETYLENLSVAYLSGKNPGDYLIGLNTTVTISEDGIDDAKDFVWTRCVPVQDVSVTSVSFDTTDAAANDKIPLTFAITNTGEQAVTSVNFSYSRLYSSGSLGSAYSLETVYFDTPLLPGESTEVTVTSGLPYPKKEETSYVVTAKAGMQELKFDNSEITVTFGAPDVSLSLEYIQAGDKKELQACVRSEGLAAVSGTVTYYDSDGSIIGKSAFDDLERGQSVAMLYGIDDSLAVENGGSVRAELALHIDEVNTSDNTASLYIPPETLIPGIVSISQDGGTIAARINLESASSEAIALMACYDADGRFLGVREAEMSGTVKQKPVFELIDGTAKVRVFVVTEDFAPLYEAKELVITDGI